MQEAKPEQPSPDPSPVPGPLTEVCTLKRSKIVNYPYYPVTATFAHKQLLYLFGLENHPEIITLIVTPIEYKPPSKYNKYLDTYIELECLPLKNVNLLEVLAYEDVINPNGKSISVRAIEFMVGFASGWLVKCLYRHPPGGKRELAVVGRFNRRPSVNQGLIMRMTSTFFTSEQFYKVAVLKPVRSFVQHEGKSTAPKYKYKYSYLIGNRLYLGADCSEQLESSVLKTFSEVEWPGMPVDTMTKLQSSNFIVINCKTHRSLISPKAVLIDWVAEIACYVYTANNELILADNQQNKIMVMGVHDNLRLRAIYTIDMDVKRMSYTLQPKGSQDNKDSQDKQEQAYLSIMPYSNNFYLLNLTSGKVAAIEGHHSYITQSRFVTGEHLLTSGCDQMIGLKDITRDIAWNDLEVTKVTSDKATKYYAISSGKMQTSQFTAVHNVADFVNVNSERNNSFSYGFGNFLSLGQNLYAFLSYDYNVKVYKLAL